MIRAAHLSRSFGDRLVVDDLTLDVRAGEVFVLLGPNGAGKTTTLRMLAGLIPPSSGSATIDGLVLSRRTAGAIRAQVGFLTEAPGLWERLSVRKNLLVYARLYGLAEAEEVVARSLATFGLADRAASLAAELSKGMKQKLALARALIHQPRVVLLDEPTSGLDPQTAKTVRELMLDLRRQGRAIMISTHNLDEAERVADRVGVLQRRLIAEDSPAALRKRLFGQRIRIDVGQHAVAFQPVAERAGAAHVESADGVLSIAVDRPAEQTPAIIRALVGAGAAIQSVVPEEAPLEDVYLKLLE